jgi:hypothetical protein
MTAGVMLLSIMHKTAAIDQDTIKTEIMQISMLGGSLVTTAWRVLRLRMEGTPSRYGG